MRVSALYIAPGSRGQAHLCSKIMPVHRFWDIAWIHLLQPSCVHAEPVFMQCMRGKRPYQHIFTEAYAMLAVLAGLCLIPIARVFPSL